jgi:hypothetical protein
METVEVVIKIPKEIIDHVNKFGTIFYNEYISYIADELRTAAILPNGHGRLIDADELIKDYGNPDIEILLENMDTIIEADKEVDKE